MSEKQEDKVYGWVTPEKGGFYIDVMNASDTEGDAFECVDVKKPTSVWEGAAFMMRHVKSGEIGKYGTFDWSLSSLPTHKQNG